MRSIRTPPPHATPLRSHRHPARRPPDFHARSFPPRDPDERPAQHEHLQQTRRKLCGRGGGRGGHVRGRLRQPAEHPGGGAPQRRERGPARTGRPGADGAHRAPERHPRPRRQRRSCVPGAGRKRPEGFRSLSRRVGEGLSRGRRADRRGQGRRPQARGRGSGSGRGGPGPDPPRRSHDAALDQGRPDRVPRGHGGRRRPGAGPAQGARRIPDHVADVRHDPAGHRRPAVGRVLGDDGCDPVGRHRQTVSRMADVMGRLAGGDTTVEVPRGIVGTRWGAWPPPSSTSRTPPPRRSASRPRPPSSAAPPRRPAPRTTPIAQPAPPSSRRWSTIWPRD